MGQLPARLGQRARRRAVIATTINKQATAIVTVDQRVKQLEDAFEWAANLTFWQRIKWLVLGR